MSLLIWRKYRCLRGQDNRNFYLHCVCQAEVSLKWFDILFFVFKAMLLDKPNGWFSYWWLRAFTCFQALFCIIVVELWKISYETETCVDCMTGTWHKVSQTELLVWLSLELPLYHKNSDWAIHLIVHKKLWNRTFLCHTTSPDQYEMIYVHYITHTQTLTLSVHAAESWDQR